MPDKETLNHLLDLTDSWIQERDRLGDFDANSGVISDILRIIEHLVEHAIETHPETRKEKKTATAPVRGGKKSTGKVLRGKA